MTQRQRLAVVLAVMVPVGLVAWHLNRHYWQCDTWRTVETGRLYVTHEWNNDALARYVSRFSELLLVDLSTDAERRDRDADALETPLEVARGRPFVHRIPVPVDTVPVAAQVSEFLQLCNHDTHRPLVVYAPGGPGGRTELRAATMEAAFRFLTQGPDRDLDAALDAAGITQRKDRVEVRRVLTGP